MLGRSQRGEGKPAPRQFSESTRTWTSAMAEPALKLAPPQPDTAAVPGKRPSAGGGGASCRMILLVVLPLIALVGGVALLSRRRPLCLDRQCLCRRPEGADHAGHLRQGQPRRWCAKASMSRPAIPVRDRSRAIPARAEAGAEQARHRAHRFRQSEDATISRSSRLVELGQRHGRAQAARRRAQDDAARQQGGTQVDVDNAKRRPS